MGSMGLTLDLVCKDRLVKCCSVSVVLYVIWSSMGPVLDLFFVCSMVG